jgi:hypothetical protein
MWGVVRRALVAILCPVIAQANVPRRLHCATDSSTEPGSDWATKVEQMCVIRPDRPWFDAP